MQFTEDQKKVIETRNKNILVSAAAGSGKTAVLVQRILSRITGKDPIDIDRLLIVTFTSAAAAEMRERIHAALLQSQTEHPEDENLQRQAALIHNAQITTIDSYCMFLLRNHFHEIDLDPSFRIGDPGEIRLLEKGVMQSVLEEAYAKAEPSFLELADALSPDAKDGRLEALVDELYRYADSHPWPEEWLLHCRKELEHITADTLWQTQWMQYLLQRLEKTLQAAVSLAGAAQKICEKPAGPYMYAECLEQDEAFLQDCLAQSRHIAGIEDLYALGERIIKVKWSMLSRKKDESVGEAERQQAKDLRDSYKVLLAKLAMYFSDPADIMMEREHQAAALSVALIDLTLAYREALAQAKKEKNILDFSDAEHAALSVLIRDDELTETAKSYQAFYEEVMIDEYQDSNMVQELLLSSVSRKGEKPDRFMVGDMKQSIYKFRLARPEIFMEKYRSYQSGEEESCLITLKKNFRSCAEILESVNDVFSVIMEPEIGGIAYDADARLYPGLSMQPGSTELLLYESQEEDTLTAREGEAYMIAEQIRALVGREQIEDVKTGQMHTLSYRDIVILVRGGASAIEQLQAVLTEEGIPVHVTSKTGYFSAMEVSLFMDFLRVCNNPYEDIPFCSVATSLFMGFTEDELAMIRAKTTRGRSLYESFREYVLLAEDPEQAEDPVLAEKIQKALQMLTELREQAVTDTMPEFAQAVMRRFHYIEYMTALPGGEQRRANLEMLLEKTVEFEATSYHGLFQFIRYMQQLQKYDVDFGESSLLSEQADVVRIMTIHKSKGLEFPVCFVAGLDRKFNLRDTTKQVLMDADWGIAMNYIDSKRQVTGKTLHKQMLAEKLKRDSLGEETRVLYVAMTRAKQRLYLTAATKKAEERLLEYAYLQGEDTAVSDYERSSVGCFLDDILLARTKHAEHIGLRIVREENLRYQNLAAQAAQLGRKEALELLEQGTEDPLYESLQERFSYVYPHAGLQGLYTKTSVSELKIAAMDEEVHQMFETEDVTKPYLPAFMREEEKSGGTARGSAFHRLLELLDIAAYRNYDSAAERKKALQQDIASFVAQGRMSEEYGSLIDIRKIDAFLQSDVAGRMAAAQEKGLLFKEQPFVLSVAADEVQEGFPASEKVLVQGIIDVYFEEADGIVILDYKTDRVQSMEELWNRYETQLDYYGQAVARLSGKPVKEKIIYSFAKLEEASHIS